MWLSRRGPPSSSEPDSEEEEESDDCNVKAPASELNHLLQSRLHFSRSSLNIKSLRVSRIDCRHQGTACATIRAIARRKGIRHEC